MNFQPVHEGKKLTVATVARQRKRVWAYTRKENAGHPRIKDLQIFRRGPDFFKRSLELSPVGLRLSPFADYNNVRDPDPIETYSHLTRWLDGAGVAFLHLADTNA